MVSLPPPERDHQTAPRSALLAEPSDNAAEGGDCFGCAPPLDRLGAEPALSEVEGLSQ